MSINMDEMGQLLRMGMRILPAPSPGGGSIVTTFVSCSRFWLLFYAFWLLFMDMFFTIFPTTLIFISIMTFVLHYSRIPSPPDQFVHAVFGIDPNIVPNTSDRTNENNSNKLTNTNGIARQLANKVMGAAINPGSLNLNVVMAGIAGLTKNSLGNPLGKVSDDGYATPAPDLILEQGVVPDKYEVPLPVIGHRGASADVPENCLGALEYCKGKGCDFAFLDVSITKDNVGVLFHDESLARIAGINKKLKDLTWDQVQDVDVSELHHHRDKFRGQSVPSLELAVDTCIELNIKFFINVVDSSDEMIDAVCRAYKLNKAMYSMAAVTSFHWKVIYGIRKRDPKIIGCLAFPLSHESKQKLDPSARTYSLQSSGISAMEWLNESYANFLDWFVEAFLWWYLGLTAVFIHKDCISKNEIRDWGLKGIRVFLWMVDTKEEKQYISKILKVGYLTRTLANDPILTSRKKNKESAADSNRRKLSKNFAGSKNSAESVSSEDSMHSIPPSPEMSLHSEYIQQMLA